jgi:hypothetical protein
MAAIQLLFDFSDPPNQPYGETSPAFTGIPSPVRAMPPSPMQPDHASINSGFTFAPYGAWVNFGKRLATSERLRKNRKAIALLSKPCGQLSPTDMDTLRAYSGWGGLNADNERGVLYDYYTSPPVASLTWRLLHKIQPIHKKCRILEPSCGTGVFFAAGPSNVDYTGVELDERTAAIAAILHPAVTVIPKSYEAFNLSGNSAGSFDHIIGNVPFGERTLDTAFMDMPEEKSLDRYFITRSLDNLKPGGTMALIAHPGILANRSSAEWRMAINRKAQFMGAVKLNDVSFNHTHTNIQPDILFFRKHPEDIHRRLQTFSSADTDTSGLAQKGWIDGPYFAARPDHVMGTVQAGKGQWGSDVISGSVTPLTLQALLDTFIPETAFSEQVYDRIRGTAALSEQVVKMSTLSLNNVETEALEHKALSIGSVKIVGTAVYILSGSYRWNLAADDPPLAERISRILTISGDIKHVRRRMREGLAAPALQQTVAAALNAYNERYGAYPKDDGIISRFLRNHPAVSGIYDALIDPASGILTVSNLYDSNGVPVNGHNRAVEALLFLQQRMLEGSAKTIRRYFPDDGEGLIAEMYRNPDIFLSEHRIWQLREDFISGNAWGKIDRLAELRGAEQLDAAIRGKWQYGIAELEKAAGWTPIEEADFSPHSSWIPEEIINAWAGDEDGLDRSGLLRYGSLARNETGKWGIRYKHDFSRKETRDGQEVTVAYQQGEWAYLNDEIVYYLNMQKQRSAYYDTETFNREHNDSFKNYIVNHKTFREELEKSYNRIFNTEIGVPVKTYPVYLEGWHTEVKTLKAHQWQSVHHLYREGKGISALGAGFGKTLAATGLHALLKQEGRIKRAWFQVPNNKVKDWISEIHEVLPRHTIGFVDPEMPGYTSRDKRYALYQRLANGQSDIILMPESSAGEIQLSPEQDALITEQVIWKHIGEKGEGKSERYIENLKESVARKLENGKTNRTICFEDFGCDAVFVDEAHRYKNLFSSTLSRETGLNDGRQSAKAMSLFKKAEYIRRINDGKNIYLLTATPLTNSPLEYFNMLMYIAPEELERFGIHTIDGFIKNFADIETGAAYDWQSGTVTEKKILKGFKNIKTLQDIFFKYTDYQNDLQKINLEKPDAHNHPNVIPLNPEQTGILQAISAELERYKKLDKEERRELFPGQNYLTFYSKMRTASLDLELYDPNSYQNWPNPKLESLANNARQNYLATKGGQVIFCDRVFSGDGTFNIHNKIKQALCGTGFKADEIVIVNGFTKSGGLKSDSRNEKEVSQAVAAFNQGTYKAIIGSTACIGEGLNLQENSAALHHFDIPFRPSDFIQRNGRIDRQGNAQQSVELHTYMSAGTIDNYSVSLVQRKANWIDQLLRTTSNVFLNPNDESYVDADELLLALTEEWGDAAKAEERRKEMERIKAGKLLEGRHIQRKNNLASLSLMRNALCGFSGDKGSASYQNRIRKIRSLESGLLSNPAFTQHHLVKTSVPFLYAKETDSIIRKGDILILSGDQYTVASLNFRKQECTLRRLIIPENGEAKDRSITIHEFGHDDGRLVHIPQPDMEERRLIKVLHTEDFYRHPNAGLKERYYTHHLRCASSNNEFTPLVFTISDGGALLIKELRYYLYGYGDVCYLNPYKADDKETVRYAAQKDIVFYDEPERDAWLKWLQRLLPEIHELIVPSLNHPIAEGVYEKSA